MFVFFENEESYDEYNRKKEMREGLDLTGVDCAAGEFEAVVRLKRCLKPPKAVGVLIGTTFINGYDSLTDEVRDKINLAIVKLRQIVVFW